MHVDTTVINMNDSHIPKFVYEYSLANRKHWGGGEVGGGGGE
jgi:hypothetical protein